MTQTRTLLISLALSIETLSASAARAQDSLVQPTGSSVLVGAVQWLQGAMLGTVATSLAVIAIALLGFGMLTGRIDVRRAFAAILGCFIIFLAPSIAAGILEASKTEVANISGAPAASPSPLPSFNASPEPYDPYAGASVPTR